MPEQHPSRVLVMTGGTSGLGAEAVTVLQRDPGIRIILGARDVTTTPSRQGVEKLPLDLASLQSVRDFAAAVQNTLDGSRIEMLVLNAGAQFRNDGERTIDGFESTFAVNHLAHYLLARLLLPLVADGGRIILTTSDTHDPDIIRGAPTRLDIDAWAHPDPDNPGSALRAYSASKLTNLLTAQALAALPDITQRRITTIAYNPGLTGGTGLQRSMPAVARGAMTLMRPLFAVLGRIRPWMHMGTPEVAGGALARLSDGTDTPPRGRIYASLVRGQLTYPDPSTLAQDPAARDALWAASAKMTALPA